MQLPVQRAARSARWWRIPSAILALIWKYALGDRRIVGDRLAARRWGVADGTRPAASRSLVGEHQRGHQVSDQAGYTPPPPQQVIVGHHAPR
jgi:hypothetical protein